MIVLNNGRIQIAAHLFRAVCAAYLTGQPLHVDNALATGRWQGKMVLNHTARGTHRAYLHLARSDLALPRCPKHVDPQPCVISIGR